MKLWGLQQCCVASTSIELPVPFNDNISSFSKTTACISSSISPILALKCYLCWHKQERKNKSQTVHVAITVIQPFCCKHAFLECYSETQGMPVDAPLLGTLWHGNNISANGQSQHNEVQCAIMMSELFNCSLPVENTQQCLPPPWRCEKSLYHIPGRSFVWPVSSVACSLPPCFNRKSLLQFTCDRSLRNSAVAIPHHTFAFAIDINPSKNQEKQVSFPCGHRNIDKGCLLCENHRTVALLATPALLASPRCCGQPIHPITSLTACRPSQ